MKKAILSFGFLICAVVFGFAQDGGSISVGGPKADFDKLVHDYGTISKGANGTCEFVLTNTGTEPLIISNCKGSCGCTVPKCQKEPIKPGESTKIQVKYDTKRPGTINKSVTVNTNDPEKPTTILRIKGFVEQAQTSPVVKPAVGAPVSK